MQALQAVYANNYEGRVKVSTMVQQAPPFDGNKSLSARMMRRLIDWEEEYSQVGVG